MILIAWIALIAAIVWLIGNGKQPWIARILQRKRDTIRVLAFGVSALIAAGCVWGLVLTLQNETGETRSLSFAPWVVFGAGLIGAVTYSVGLVIWEGRKGAATRFAGWILMGLAAAIPSSASLSLPLIALLAITVGHVPKSPAAATPVPTRFSGQVVMNDALPSEAGEPPAPRAPNGSPRPPPP
jgi:hypothetical protein